MLLNKLSALGLTAALLVGASTAAMAEGDTSKKLYLGVGNTSAEYWTQMIWGATQVMQSVGGDVEVIGNDFDPQKSLQNIGAIVAPGNPQELGALLRVETDRWGKVIRAAGITAE